MGTPVEDGEDKSGENVGENVRVPPPPRHEAMPMESLNPWARFVVPGGAHITRTEVPLWMARASKHDYLTLHSIRVASNNVLPGSNACQHA